MKSPDLERFPVYDWLMKPLMSAARCRPILNAANEIAVEAFLDEQIRFTDIPVIIERCMEKFASGSRQYLEIILAADLKPANLSTTNH